MHWVFDFEDGSYAMPLSDNMAVDSEGSLSVRMGDRMAMEMDSGDLHMVSGWPDEDD